MGTILTTIVSSNVYSVRDYIFFLLNLAIIAAYMTVVLTTAFPSRIMPVLCYVFSRRSRLSVAAFFLMASVTRAELAWDAVKQSQIAECPNTIIDNRRVLCLVDVSTSAIVLHVFQVILVWMMIIFLGIDIFRKFQIVRKDDE